MFPINENGIMTECALSGSQKLIRLNPPPTMPISTPIPVHQPANLDQLKYPPEVPVLIFIIYNSFSNQGF